PSTGFRQDFFKFIELPKSIIVDWKLAQSLMSLALFGILFLLIYFPKAKKEDEQIAKEDKFLEEDSLDNIAFNILNQEIKYEGYIPVERISESKKSRFSKFISIARKSDLIQVINLLCLNVALSTLLITILMNLGVPIISQISYDYDQFYIEMSRAFWAGFHEEITYRWILFGLPLFVLNGIYFIFMKITQFTVLRGKKENIEKSRLTKFLLRRELKNPLLYLTGRWKRFGFFDFIFLIFSSFCFGYVHFHPGNWLEGKIFQAAIAGLIFGYGFYKYGLHAAIFLHVANNFIVGMIITPNLGLMLNGGFLYFLTILLGSFVLIFTLFSPLSSMFKFLNRKLRRINEEGYIASNKKT
ncbi:MAG: CPBP family intramembrane glutamic endopeptidase, partial [Candidatus Thorarchaeota archaeon]